ncbi:MAG: NAD(P)/FAD-dependent oxidoreductase [Acidobacteria bacterium]|nr:NAD(P)/FAD-dependent oxidoreductase [Acidobacteriota bacterium]
MVKTIIVGAGPYGLSVAAHLRRNGIPCRVFGRPMDSWLEHMPQGMLLKSDGFASNIYDPDKCYTLKQFCAEQGIQYADTGIPVSLDTFAAYGLAFKDRLVPELENKLVTSIEAGAAGFTVRLDTGESLDATRVVLAVGITHFENVPSTLAHLPPAFLSHSARHRELERFKGRSVAVIGAGASALDLAGLLYETGADVHLVSRRKQLRFHSKPTGKSRSWWQQIRHPQSGLGPGLRSRFFAEWPWAFHYLPERIRIEAVRRSLGPSGGWFIKDKVIGNVDLLLGYTPTGAQIEDGRVHLRMHSSNHCERSLTVDHIIAATGYKVDLERLTFLSRDIRSKIRTLDRAPVLSTRFESSVRGLYFVGVAAANSFGPVMRFAFGAGFAARTVTHALKNSLSTEHASLSVSSIATAAK